MSSVGPRTASSSRLQADSDGTVGYWRSRKPFWAGVFQQGLHAAQAEVSSAMGSETKAGSRSVMQCNRFFNNGTRGTRPPQPREERPSSSVPCMRIPAPARINARSPKKHHHQQDPHPHLTCEARDDEVLAALCGPVPCPSQGYEHRHNCFVTSPVCRQRRRTCLWRRDAGQLVGLGAVLRISCGQRLRRLAPPFSAFSRNMGFSRCVRRGKLTIAALAGRLDWAGSYLLRRAPCTR
jgi:hypothetical protein